MSLYILIGGAWLFILTVWLGSIERRLRSRGAPQQKDELFKHDWSRRP